MTRRFINQLCHFYLLMQIIIVDCIYNLMISFWSAPLSLSNISINVCLSCSKSLTNWNCSLVHVLMFSSWSSLCTTQSLCLHFKHTKNKASFTGWITEWLQCVTQVMVDHIHWCNSWSSILSTNHTVELQHQLSQWLYTLYSTWVMYYHCSFHS